MSSLLESIMGQLGGSGMQQIAQQLGTDEEKGGQATSAALTTLLGALSRNSTQSGGADALHAALQRDHDGSVLDNLSGFLQQPDTATGDGILKHVLGGKRGRVERSLGQATGVQADKMGELLKTLAPIVMGALGRQQRQGGQDAGSLASMLGQERQAVEERSPAGGVLSSLLDSDGDGDVDASDLLKQGGGLLGKFFGGR